MFKRNPKEFLRRFVTVDETCFHLYPPAMQAPWYSPGKRAHKKTKMVESVAKVMATVVGTRNYLKKGRTITGQYYADLLGRFEAELMKKQQHLAKKKVLFQHDNAPAHSSAISTAKMVELLYELLPHPSYSPNLASCDCFLFPNMKKRLGGKQLMSNEKVIAATEAYSAEFDKPYFLDGLKKLKYRWPKCSELKGDYLYTEK